MGVAGRRIAYAALVGAAILLAVRKPGNPVKGGSSMNRDLRAQELSLRAANARFNWSALEQRDSVVATGGKPGVTLSGFSPNAKLVQQESTYVATVIERGVRDSNVHIALRLYQGNGYGPSWWGLYYGDLINTGPALRCTAILPASEGASGRVVVGRHRLAAVLGPCLLLGAFGAPGKTVGDWLQLSRYAPAGSSEWLTRESEDRWDSGPWGWMTDGSFWNPAAPRGSTLSRLLGLEQVTRLLAPPYHYGQMGVQCLAGLKESCARAVVGPGVLAQKTVQLPDDLTISPSQIRSSDISVLTPRPPGPTFLSDLIQEKGAERFSAFWKSSAPFERAFEEAFQVSLADWTFQWAQKRWLATWDARYQSPQILVGVTLHPLWIPVLIGWSALSIGAAGWAARRRQVTAM